jgi:hypothetical protein
MKFGGARIVGGNVELVDRHHERAARPAELAGDRRVLGQQTRLPVDHEEHGIGLRDRGTRLRLDGGVEALLSGSASERLEAGRVHQEHRPSPCLDFFHDAIAREPGMVVDQRPSPSGEAIEERGLATLGRPTMAMRGGLAARMGEEPVREARNFAAWERKDLGVCLTIAAGRN